MNYTLLLEPLIRGCRTLAHILISPVSSCRIFNVTALTVTDINAKNRV